MNSMEWDDDGESSGRINVASFKFARLPINLSIRCLEVLVSTGCTREASTTTFQFFFFHC